jgi:hypothetical protein
MARAPRGFIVLLITAVLTMAATSSAQTGDKAEARKLFFEAREALNSGDFIRAASLYRQANDLYPAPTSALGLARSLVQLGRLVEAAETYEKLSKTRLAEDASDAFENAVADGKREGEALEKRIPRLTLIVDGPTPSRVTIDDEAVALSGKRTTLRLDPGKLEVTASHQGYQPFETTVALAESTVSEVRIALVPMLADEPDASSPDDGLDGLQVSGIVIGSVGLAGLVAWGVTGALYLDAESTVEDDCENNRCQSQTGLDAADRAQTLGIVNTVSLFAGLGLVAVGTTLFLIGGDSEAEPTVALRVGPTIGIDGTF